MPRQSFGLHTLQSSFLCSWAGVDPRVFMQGPCGHLGSRSGLSFLQHGHNSYQPHLGGSVAVQYFPLCS